MKILLVTARYLPHRGGLETVVHHLAREFSRAGHELLIVANRYPRTLPAQEVIDGIPVSRMQFLYPQMRFLKEKRLDLLAASLWFAPFTAWKLWQTLRQFEPDIVHLQYLGSPAFFLSFLYRLKPFLWVVTLQGGDVDGEPYLSPQGMRLFKRSTQQADIVTACSKDLATQAIALSPSLEKKLRVIHNGVDCQAFAAAGHYQHGKPYIAAVGQLVIHKGFDLLIRAFGDVASAHPSIDLLIAGEGECRQELAALVKELYLSDRVYLLGRVDEGTVASLMAGSLLVAVPSRREPFGIVVLEGMAAGRPVLATPVGGIPEFLPNGINRLVIPERQAWAEALSELLTKDQLGQLDGESNRAVAQDYGWSHVAERYLDAYAEAGA